MAFASRWQVVIRIMSIDKQSSKIAFVCDVCGARFAAEDTNHRPAGLQHVVGSCQEAGLAGAPAARRQMAHRMPGVRDRRLETMELEIEDGPLLRCRRFLFPRLRRDAPRRVGICPRGSHGPPSAHLLNNPMIAALASVLKCKLKPTTATAGRFPSSGRGCRPSSEP